MTPITKAASVSEILRRFMNVILWIYVDVDATANIIKISLKLFIPSPQLAGHNGDCPGEKANEAAFGNAIELHSRERKNHSGG